MNTHRYFKANTDQCQQGFSLVEIMVALVISLFLTAGIIQLFISSQQTYRVTQALSRLQENGRFIIDRMAFDIRMAGYNPDIWTPIPNAVVVGPKDADENNDITVQYSNAAGTATISKRYFIDNDQRFKLSIDSGTPQELVEGVRRMQILPQNCTGSSTHICSIRINLLLVSLENNLATASQSIEFPKDPSEAGPDPQVDVGRSLAQIISTTVAIRNSEI